MRPILTSILAMIVFAQPGVVVLNGIDEAVKAVVVLGLGTIGAGLSAYLAATSETAQAYVRGLRRGS